MSDRAAPHDPPPAPAGARTDQTWVCVACMSRFGRADRCPRCGERAVYDLRSRGVRQRVLYLLKRRRADRRVALALAGRADLPTTDGQVARVMRRIFLLGVAPLLLLVLTLGLVSLPPLLTLCIGLALGAAVEFVPPVLAAVRTRRALGPPARVEVVAAPAADAAVETVTVRGRVRVREPVRAPLSDAPCAAFRLAGACATGAIDDAAVGAFELVTDDGEVVAIEPGGAAALALPLPAPARAAEPTAALAAFLKPRGVGRWRDELALAEAVLRDGDEVTARGCVAVHAAGRDYRGSGFARVLCAPPGGALEIARAEPARVRAAPGGDAGAPGGVRVALAAAASPPRAGDGDDAPAAHAGGRDDAGAARSSRG